MSGATYPWVVRARFGCGREHLRRSYRFPSRETARQWLRTMRALQRKPEFVAFVATQPIRIAKGRA